MKPSLIIAGVAALLGAAALAMFGLLRRNQVVIESAEGAETGVRAQ